MSRTVLVDVNVPREVCMRLRELGFDVVYLTDVFPRDANDEEIFDWIRHHQVPILTRDRSFPEDEENLKITLTNESPLKMARRAFLELMERRLYPKPLSSS